MTSLETLQFERDSLNDFSENGIMFPFLAIDVNQKRERDREREILALR